MDYDGCLLPLKAVHGSDPVAHPQHGLDEGRDLRVAGGATIRISLDVSSANVPSLFRQHARRERHRLHGALFQLSEQAFEGVSLCPMLLWIGVLELLQVHELPTNGR